MRVYFLWSILLASSLGCLAQSTAPANPAGPTTLGSAVKILQPKAGAKLTVNFVQLQYELENASSASSSPTFRLRLDARDAVDTTDTTYTFTGLTPGPHSVSIVVVDANGTPVSGAQSEIRFMVAPATPAPSAAPAEGHRFGSWFSLVPRAEAASTSTMESSNSDLGSLIPWLACGIIVGGIISAARTRSAGPASK